MLKACIAILFSSIISCTFSQTVTLPVNGSWRALLHRDDGNEIIFNMEIKDSLGKKIAYVKNGRERLIVDDISQNGDSIFIRMPFFDSQIRAVYNGHDQLKGDWIKRLADRDQSMPFTANNNQHFRFETKTPAVASRVSGRWDVRFWVEGQTDTTLAVGEFKQKGSSVTGTFLTTTGDYRFLEGVISGDSLKLSCFDGGHAYLFTAKILDGKTLSDGRYFSGPTHTEKWFAKKDDHARLPDEFSVTRLKANAPPLDFTFRALDGKPVSLHDSRFRNKVVVIQLMGSWCPNCMDETNYLSGFYNEYHRKGIEVIGLAYERSTDFEKASKNLASFQKRFQVQYPLLITGVSVDDSARAEKTLPQIERIEGFPTTIFVGRSGAIEKIHTGFNGPATGEHYDEEKKTFEKLVNQLLAE